MKKKFLLLPIVAGFAYITLTSSSSGAAHTSGYDVTGAETGLSNPTGCYANGSCHSSAATTGITVALELDSSGVATTHYKGGMSYTVKITGTNTTTNNLPKFGFQVACIKGSTPQTTPVNAGAFATSGLPAGVQYTAARAGYFVCNVMEHSTQLAPATGSGASGTIYTESFAWTAPAAGTGAISFWGALNAVNDDLIADAADKWNTNHLIVNEWPVANLVGALPYSIHINAFPNPVSNTLNLQFEDAQGGSYSVHVFNITGKCVANENIEVSAASQNTIINTINWTPGTYQVAIEKEGNKQVIQVVKK
jgi:hypothetical protein